MPINGIHQFDIHLFSLVEVYTKRGCVCVRCAYESLSCQSNRTMHANSYSVYTIIFELRIYYQSHLFSPGPMNSDSMLSSLSTTDTHGRYAGVHTKQMVIIKSINSVSGSHCADDMVENRTKTIYIYILWNHSLSLFSFSFSRSVRSCVYPLSVSTITFHKWKIIIPFFLCVRVCDVEKPNPIATATQTMRTNLWLWSTKQCIKMFRITEI